MLKGDSANALRRSANWDEGEGTQYAPESRTERQGGRDHRTVGIPDYAALNVFLDDGSQQLFWHHELDPVDDL
jgi:hypothetical protein